MPDLSALGTDLLGRMALSAIFIDVLPPGTAQSLMGGYVRTVEATLRHYNRAREQLESASREEHLMGFLRGCGEMETTLWLLHKAMRSAEELMRSPETKVSKDELPSGTDRERLKAMRNAIDHGDKAVVAGRAGQGESLALEVRDEDMTIHDLNGREQTVTFESLAEWVSKLHALAVELIDYPSEWAAQPAT
jgi:hypothetical protein